MLSLAVVEEIRRLLNEGRLSQRKIAARLGVSRGSVSAIASGRRGIFGREPEPDKLVLSAHELPPERCTGCGARVRKPCLLCRARAYRERHRVFLHSTDIGNCQHPRRVA